jgi:hypothetical protein
MAFFFIAIGLVVLAAAYVVVRTLREKRAQTGTQTSRSARARSSRAGDVQRAGR